MLFRKRNRYTFKPYITWLIFLIRNVGKKKVIISSKKTFFVGIMHVSWSFFGFLVDFCVFYLVCMLSDIFRRNSGPVYWVNISISTSWSSDDQAPSSVSESESRSRFAFAWFPLPLALASSGSNSMSLSSFSPSSSPIGLDLSSSSTSYPAFRLS